MSKIKIGDIAICSHGKVGIIENKKDDVWVGSQLEESIHGTPWQSKNPMVIGHIDVEKLGGQTIKVV